jgi:hypothetical protein
MTDQIILQKDEFNPEKWIRKKKRKPEINPETKADSGRIGGGIIYSNSSPFS